MSTSKKFTFVGCSITAGEGIPNELERWVNIVADHYQVTPLNLAVNGNSLNETFMSAVHEILFNCPDVLFVQWGTHNRVTLYPDTYLDHPLRIQVNSVPEQILERQQNLNAVKVFDNKQQAQTFIDQLILLNHEYYRLTELLDYVNILQTMAKDKCSLVFTNGIARWTEEIQRLDTVTVWANELSPYMKDILDVDANTDDRLHQLGTALTNKFNQMDKTQWVNLFSTIHDMAIDRGTDNLHPGPRSNANYADLVIQHLNSRSK